MPRILSTLRTALFACTLLLLTTPFAALVYAATSHAAAHGPAQSDAQIDATIRTKLAKSKIGKDGFHFKVARGVVTWEGRTDVIQHKGSATRMAKSAGAVQVVNNIQISPAAKAKAAANLNKNESGSTAIKRASVS